MCGIVGAVGTKDRSSDVVLAVESLRHRGPDSGGVWREGTTTLGHRRLMIIDLAERSNQPIRSESGRHVLTYNGEIYNYPSLSDPPAPGDTLALVDGVPRALEPGRLRGMFAYGLWDREAGRLVLVRDRFGMKPLYYGTDDGDLAFASTAGGVAGMLGDPTLDQESIASYLRLGSVQGPQTMYEKVREVEPGSTLGWQDGSLDVDRYWRFEDAVGRPRADLRKTLVDAVSSHCVSDVPVALFLSGGVDSAVVAALAVEAQVDVTAFTVSFPGSEIDEAEEARCTAQAMGLKHEVVDIALQEPAFDAYFEATDQPSIDGLNTFIVSQAAAESGFRVAISGLGADELFAGYNGFRRIPALVALNSVLPAPLAGRVLGLSSGNRAKAPALAGCGPRVGPLYEELRSVFGRDEVQRLTGVSWRSSNAPAAGLSTMDTISRLELAGYLRNTLLRDADVFAMAHSLELRTPFVDHEVLAAALSIPPVLRAVSRKRLLARAVGSERLNELVRKPKRGFRLPYGHWLRSALAPRVDELGHGPLSTVCDRSEVEAQVARWRQGLVHDSKLWSLVALDAWLRRRSPHDGQAASRQGSVAKG